MIYAIAHLSIGAAFLWGMIFDHLDKDAPILSTGHDWCVVLVSVFAWPILIIPTWVEWRKRVERQRLARERQEFFRRNERYNFAEEGPW